VDDERVLRHLAVPTNGEEPPLAGVFLPRPCGRGYNISAYGLCFGGSLPLAMLLIFDGKDLLYLVCLFRRIMQRGLKSILGFYIESRCENWYVWKLNG